MATQLIHWAIDWSGNGIDVYNPEHGHQRFESLMVFLDYLATIDAEHVIHLESTFESYVPQRRQAFLERCSQAGITVLTTPGRLTARYRKAHGIEKTDANDAQVIYRIATEGRTHLKKAEPVDQEWAERSARVNREHTMARFMGLVPQAVEQFEAIIGSPDTLDDKQRLAFLTADGGWRSHAVAAILRAAGEARSRQEFERFLGLYEHGYPSHLRSDVVFWGYVGGVSGRKKGPRMSWSAYRRQLRRAYRQIKQAGSL